MTVTVSDSGRWRCGPGDCGGIMIPALARQSTEYSSLPLNYQLGLNLNIQATSTQYYLT